MMSVEAEHPTAAHRWLSRDNQRQLGKLRHSWKIKSSFPLSCCLGTVVFQSSTDPAIDSPKLLIQGVQPTSWKPALDLGGHLQEANGNSWKERLWNSWQAERSPGEQQKFPASPENLLDGLMSHRPWKVLQNSWKTGGNS